MKRILSLVLTFYSIGVFSNNPDSTEYKGNRVFSYGVGWNTKNYKFLSHINYEGPSFNLNQNFFWESEYKISDLNFFGGIGKLSNSISNASIYALSLGIDYSYNWNWYTQGGFAIFSGLKINSELDVNYLSINFNNPVAGIVASNLYLSNLINYSYSSQNLSFKILNKTTVSTVGFTLFAPEYSFVVPYYYYEEEESSFTSSINFLNIGNYLNFQNKLQIDIKSPFLPSNTFRLSYIFNGLDATINHNDYNYAKHVIMFGVVYKYFSY